MYYFRHGDERKYPQRKKTKQTNSTLSLDYVHIYIYISTWNTTSRVQQRSSSADANLCYKRHERQVENASQSLFNTNTALIFARETQAEKHSAPGPLSREPAELSTPPSAQTLADSTLALWGLEEAKTPSYHPSVPLLSRWCPLSEYRPSS